MPLPCYQAGTSESRVSRIATTLVGAVILIGLIVAVASTVDGPDSLGAVLFAGLAISGVIIFCVYALRSRGPKQPKKLMTGSVWLDAVVFAGILTVICVAAFLFLCVVFM